MPDIEVHTLTREQWVARPLAEVFPFFEEPESLALITPPRMRFRVLTPSPVEMEQGRIIDYSLRVMGMPVRWRSLISTYDPPHCFVDEQLMGPYSFWHHTHRFDECQGGTRLTDVVRYALPALMPSPVAAAVHRLQVRPMLEEIFDYRGEQFRQRFGGGASHPMTDATARPDPGVRPTRRDERAAAGSNPDPEQA